MAKEEQKGERTEFPADAEPQTLGETSCSHSDVSAPQASGWCRRGTGHIWAQAQAFCTPKQSGGVDDLWCYS